MIFKLRNKMGSNIMEGSWIANPSSADSEREREVPMFRWLKQIFTRKPYRTAQPWETPPEVRTKLRCAIAGIDPATVQEPQDGKSDPVHVRPPLETPPPMKR